jgi:L-iditol 2-dehydrogenase
VNTQMMAAVLYGKEHLQVEPVAVPTIHDGDILVRVKVALTCGTDVKVFRRGYHARMIVPPAVFGHELAGDVVAAGEGVTQFAIGDRVVAANSAPCTTCYFCRHGLENLCEDLLFNNGAYAEYIRIPARIVERNTYHIPTKVGYQDAALIEPLACVVRGLEETAPQPGDSIAIIGLGPIGLMFAKLAKLYEHSNPVKTIRDLTHGRGVDIAIEAVGKPETWQWAVNMVRRGGTVNFFGGCPNDSKVNLDTALLHYSEITCKASFHHTPPYIRKALDLVCAGHITASFFVNREEPLANLLEVMRHLMSHNGHLKTAILP